MDTTVAPWESPADGPVGRIVRTPGTCSGKPRIDGTRIKVEQVVLWHDRMGMTPAEIVGRWPHLTLDDVGAALAYYRDHRGEIDADLIEGDNRFEALKAAQPSILDAIRRRMPRTIKFHLDEHCDPAIASALRRRGIDVTTTPEAGLVGATDEQQVDYALPLGRVLFTQDAD